MSMKMCYGHTIVLLMGAYIYITSNIASAAFLPPLQQQQQQQPLSRKLISSFTSFKRTNGNLCRSIMDDNKDEFYDFFGDEDEEDDYLTKNQNLSKDEKKQLAKSFFANILDYDEDEMKPEEVHIILFNPNTNKEGVHTIEFPKDSGNNIILAFESQVECEQFSMNLKEQHFFDPVVRFTITLLFFFVFAVHRT
jgi:hypothetical protein